MLHAISRVYWFYLQNKITRKFEEKIDLVSVRGCLRVITKIYD